MVQLPQRDIHYGTKLNLSDKDQKWVGVKDTFKF